MHMAMVGIGLVYCYKDCHKYVDTSSMSCCQECQDASCCHECWHCNGCPACGDGHRTKDYFCNQCRPMVHCDWFDHGFCMKHKDIKQIKMCCICTQTLCQYCHVSFDWCQGCHVYICSDHKESFVCESKVVICWKCKDSYNCGHGGLYWKVTEEFDFCLDTAHDSHQ